MYYLPLSSHSELDSESIMFFNNVLFLSLYLRAKEKEKERKRKRKDALFSTSSLRSAVFLVRLKPNLFMLAIVLRTRSQLAPILTLTPLGRGILANVNWAENPTYYSAKNATLTKRIIMVNERITSRALFERSEFALLSSNFTND